MKLKQVTILTRNLSTTPLLLYGDMFKYVAGYGLYLSGSQINEHYKYADFYSSIKSVSAANPPFSGMPVENYKVTNNNTLEFYLPIYLSAGGYDVIFCNPAGYFKLSSKTDTLPISVITSLRNQ